MDDKTIHLLKNKTVIEDKCKAVVHILNAQVFSKDEKEVSYYCFLYYSCIFNRCIFFFSKVL